MVGCKGSKKDGVGGFEYCIPMGILIMVGEMLLVKIGPFGLVLIAAENGFYAARCKWRIRAFRCTLCAQIARTLGIAEYMVTTQRAFNCIFIYNY